MPESLFSNPFAKGNESKEAPSGKPAGNLNVDDVESLLNTVDDEEPPPPKKEDIKPKKEDDEEDKKEPDVRRSDVDDEDETEDEEDKKDDVKLKEEDDEEDKEKLDLKEKDEDEIEAPPRVKDIEAKYPNFFKDFPFLRKMMFRDKEITEQFGSFDEIKNVYSRVDRLNEFESQLFDGDVRDLFATLKGSNPKAYDRVVDTFLKQISEVDKEAYEDITNNLAKQIIIGMVDEARRKNNADLDKAAKALHEYLFDTDQWQGIKVRVPEEKSDEAKKIEEERAALAREKFESARGNVTVRIDNVLKSTIGEYIDPRGQMSGYEKKHAIDEVLRRLHGKIAEDSLFRKNMNKLWTFAASASYNEKSMNDIKKSYLGKSRGIISSVIKEVRGEVLKDGRNKGKEKDEPTSRGEEREPQRKIANAGRPHLQTPKANEKRKDESIEEFFARD